MARAAFADDDEFDEHESWDDSDDWDDDVDEDDEELDEADAEHDELECEDYFAMTPADTVEILGAAAAAGGAGFLRPDGRVFMPAVMTCVRCGCTDRRGCPGGCVWAAPNLCSRCVS